MGLQEITFIEEEKWYQVTGPKWLFLASKNKIQMKMSREGETFNHYKN